METVALIGFCEKLVRAPLDGTTAPRVWAALVAFFYVPLTPVSLMVAFRERAAFEA